MFELLLSIGKCLNRYLEIFDIKPDYDLNIMQQRQVLATITVKVLEIL
ncbi:UDP-N-acetylglucosamine 2-epimerase (non-hydrolysing) [Caldicoprobacter faecalis]|uniref:UDP-N-acetylglucosamine 2-epimerase (Non-hydrolysing) n=1 Tax=Caldicoprobacter faecalis TaxID=937334 RepID=A0A1I5Y6J4_9FIRM|nr:UDP-N-acetylglucosamine 2-epimerase (non-hydrolysing) [Caldicoprobacter faecalis]